MYFFAPFFIAVISFAFGGNRSLAMAAILAGAIWFVSNFVILRKNPDFVEDTKHPLNILNGCLLMAEWVLAILSVVFV
ncbi:MAG: hypothetical protein H6834_05640 [Planctomycetes bacterium]|nr:hypothetical protein [Planctomycetota bacterium]